MYSFNPNITKYQSEVKTEPMDEHDAPVDMSVGTAKDFPHTNPSANHMPFRHHPYSPYALSQYLNQSSAQMLAGKHNDRSPEKDLHLNYKSLTHDASLLHSLSNNSQSVDTNSYTQYNDNIGGGGNLTIPSVLSHSGMVMEDNTDLSELTPHQRAKREFVPDNKKDGCYWNKRIKNNDSARRSRVKRKQIEKNMEVRLSELNHENLTMKHELEALKRRFQICKCPGTENTLPTRASSIISSSSSSSSSSPTPVLKNNDKSDIAAEEIDAQSQRSSPEHSKMNGDSRLCDVAIFNPMLDLGRRERSDSIGSCASSSGSNSSHWGASGRHSIISSSSSQNSKYSNDSPSLQTTRVEQLRQDGTGALDLSREPISDRSTPVSRDSYSPESAVSEQRSRFSSDSQDSGSSAGREMKLPLKYRMKKSAFDVTYSAN